MLLGGYETAIRRCVQIALRLPVIGIACRCCSVFGMLLGGCRTAF
jgi:hypothetical protein